MAEQKQSETRPKEESLSKGQTIVKAPIKKK